LFLTNKFVKMNTIKKIVAALLLLVLVSCSKDEVVTPLPTIDDYLKSNTELSLYNAALDKAGLQAFKTGGGPFTWLAPTNAAFTTAGISADSINKMTQGTANYLLTYHIINARFATVDMIAQNSFPRATQQGTSVYVGRNANDFFINGSKITEGDKAVSNGLVHVINRVNIPPNLFGSLQTILSSTGQHSLFIAALTKANRWAQLSGTSIFSILAPTNEAMTSAGLTTDVIASATPGSVDSIVRYHYFNSLRMFSNDFGNKQTPQTALGAGRTITSSENGAKLKGKTNTSPVTIIKKDILGTNGVVHIIDGVLKY